MEPLGSGGSKTEFKTDGDVPFHRGFQEYSIFIAAVLFADCHVSSKCANTPMDVTPAKLSTAAESRRRDRGLGITPRSVPPPPIRSPLTLQRPGDVTRNSGCLVQPRGVPCESRPGRGAAPVGEDLLRWQPFSTDCQIQGLSVTKNYPAFKN
ncbi:hypothetical protein CB1_000709006 [Camelus ferus]|nr:hypothetical protein CB1_000709006 [Camelus ferus]